MLTERMASEAGALEDERVTAVLRLITQLQAEGKSVLEQKLSLLEIKERATASSIAEQSASE